MSKVANRVNPFIILALIIYVFLYVFIGQKAWATNLHAIDQDKESGFAIYRLGNPSREDMRKLCEQGVTEMMVLSGNASEFEERYPNECPTLKVIYNTAQSSRTPVTKEFLKKFDQWVQKAKEQGKAIAFRCQCGCHRTGRLSAYYRMKYNGLDAESAIDEMWELGKFMAFFRHLKAQVRDMEDYINGRPCQQKSPKKSCIIR